MADKEESRISLRLGGIDAASWVKKRMMHLRETNSSFSGKLRGFIFALTILETPAFFAIYAITGRTYAGSESSSAYVIYMIAMLGLQAFFLVGKRRIRRTEFRWLLVPLLFVGLAWLFSFIHGKQINTSIIRNALLWQYTGILLAININSYDLEGETKNALVILMLIITLGAVFSVLLPFVRGRSIYYIAGYSLTGNSFQTQSYYIALSAGINLFFFSSASKNNAVKISSYILLGVQLLCSILYAGRGGMLLALAYVVVFYFISMRRSGNRKNRLVMIVVYIAIFIILFLALGHIVDSSPVLKQRFERIFSYIGEGGIDLSQTSNRDILYSKALGYIGQSPLFGYGILGYEYLDGLNRYPHNIALELLIEGGIIYLLLWLFIVISGYRKMKRIRNTNLYELYLIAFMFSIVKLMFSSSYSYEMLFWFSIVFSHICNRNREEVPTE